MTPLLIALAAAPAATQETAAPLAAGAVEDGTGTLALGDVSDRMTVPVSINGAAPQPFIIDTGAERSVVSRQLAGNLGLSPGPQITLTTMTGSTRVPTVVVPSLSMGPLRDQRAFNAPALEARHMGAHGLLGIEQLRTHMVSIDFDKSQMAVRPSRRAGGKRSIVPLGSDEIVITAKNRLGQLIVTEATFEGVKITVVLDTGSQISIGNLALQRKMRRIRLKGPIVMTSVTGEKMTVNYHIANRVRLGGVSLGSVPVAFADIPPFEHFGLSGEPALMLGMDALRAFRRVEIDFPDRKVRFLLPRQYAVASRLS
ncbi:aspartyl protease family protein [Sphingomonas sp. BT-65]|uniref:aspartyl protease family protein n=1 Tax=Sphingomonas sp. BT-65 TaxID=2989821 RepID=UPI0022366F98|nr:aspartyl protease family protein [Sphingomonas sp. BT-65]MCW4462644.1 aspartyl protease family protein [Sphingomonas sp. BT-65]